MVQGAWREATYIVKLEEALSVGAASLVHPAPTLNLARAASSQLSAAVSRGRSCQRPLYSLRRSALRVRARSPVRSRDRDPFPGSLFLLHSASGRSVQRAALAPGPKCPYRYPRLRARPTRSSALVGRRPARRPG